MCGIAGILHYRDNSTPVDSDALIRMRDAMAARGPDGHGAWVSEDRRIGLGHRRLAIIDLSESGIQPMSTVDGRYHIVFNGEIYNYQDLKLDLERQGHRFFSTSDTEVILHLFAARGSTMFNDLRGMYAFAIWDDQDKSLFLGRDPFGIKPLYYSDDGRTLRFASQVRAILQGGGVDTTPDPAGHAGFFLLGSVPEPYTLFRSIRALPPGTCMSVDNSGEIHMESIVDITAEIAGFQNTDPVDEATATAILKDALEDTVRSHLVSDVPVGTFLSAGLDSTTIAGIASKLGAGPQHTLTIGFKEFVGTVEDEVPLAESVAKLYGTDHTTTWVRKEAFQGQLDALIQAMDQPTIDGVNTYFVSKAAADLGLKVALSGLGGDELFGGYDTFTRIPKLAKALAFSRYLGPLARVFRAVTSPVIGRFTTPKYAGLLEYARSYSGLYFMRRSLFQPWELPDLMGADFAREGLETLRVFERLEETSAGIASNRLQISALEFNWYMRHQLLRDSDWAGMAHSLEIRVPFVDLMFFRKLLPLIGGSIPPTKREMVKTLHPPLPEGVLHRPKTGFRVPVRDWLMADDKTSPDFRLRGWARIVYEQYLRVHA